MAVLRRTGGKVLISANCLLADAVGNCVYVTSDRVSGLYQVSTVDLLDQAKIPSIGVVIAKQSDTQCVVQLHGLIEGVFSGMTPNKVQFIDKTGTITETPPTADIAPGFVWIQSIGQALASDVLMVAPDPIPTKRLYRP